jgi:hypothetical protein
LQLDGGSHHGLIRPSPPSPSPAALGSLSRMREREGTHRAREGTGEGAHPASCLAPSEATRIRPRACG